MKKKRKPAVPRLKTVLRRIDNIIDICRSGAVEDSRLHHVDGWFTTSLAEWQATRTVLIEDPSRTGLIEAARRADSWNDCFLALKRAAIFELTFQFNRRNSTFALMAMAAFDVETMAVVNALAKDTNGTPTQKN